VAATELDTDVEARLFGAGEELLGEALPPRLLPLLCVLLLLDLTLLAFWAKSGLKRSVLTPDGPLAGLSATIVSAGILYRWDGL
jgi:hypothetical protein